MKKIYRIPCTWTAFGMMTIEADNLEDAIFEAENNAPIPENGEYVDDSFQVDKQVIPYYNKNLTKEEQLEFCGEVIRW